MDPLFIEKTKVSPEVTLNKDENTFRIAGRSLVEDPGRFYMPVYNWLEKYIENPNDQTQFEFDLEYFNSSSARQVMKLIILLEDIQKAGKEVQIKWLYEDGDDMSRERGEEIAAVSKIEFDIEEYPGEDFDV
jgi:hypothetical protein